MAKLKDETVIAEPSATPAAVASVIYRDKLYTSRTLVLPKNDRTLPVLKGQVEVPATDAEALAYLDASAEHELLKE